MKNYIYLMLLAFTLALIVPVQASPQVVNPPGIHLATLPASLCPDQPALTMDNSVMWEYSFMPAELVAFQPTINRLSWSGEGLYPLKYSTYCVAFVNLSTNWYSNYIPVTVSLLCGPSIPILLPGDKMHRCC